MLFHTYLLENKLKTQFLFQVVESNYGRFTDAVQVQI